ncbi:MAG TPA: patatin-like phospholipase family protein [Spirochaetota bacterium]|nr:patatin-like phospholipase family protein [Spirochaetota bacterium]
MFNPLKIFRNRKVGLALGSGGAKGLAHISVIEYLDGMGIPVNMIAGSSIGAAVGAVYCCGSLAKFKKEMLGFSRKELFSVFDITMPKSGLLKGNDFVKFLKRYIPADARIEDMPIPLSIVATDYYTGKPVIFKNGNILEAVRASISIPGVFVPVAYGSSFLIDGGVANPLPLDVLENMGAGFTIASNLHPGLPISPMTDFVKRQGKKIGILKKVEMETVDRGRGVSIPDEKPVKAWFKNIEQWLSKGEEKQYYPSIFEVMSQSIDIMGYVNTQNMLKYSIPTVLVEPDLLSFGTMDFYRAYDIITEGLRACSDKKFEFTRKIKIWL